MSDELLTSAAGPTGHRRRPRYRGRNPRLFEEKYKERDPQRYADTVAKVLASGKTPAGTHRSIMVAEILEELSPQPGEVALDCTLGYGGHAQELLPRLQPRGRLIGLDVDPIELPKTEARLRGLGFGPDALIVARSNFAGFPQVLAAAGLTGVDLVLADLGVSSMQLDNPARGFSFKCEGPLDLRMNPERGESAAALLERMSAAKLEQLLVVNADEPHAGPIALALAGRRFRTTTALAGAVRAALSSTDPALQELTVRRVFQALRVTVNNEFSALETFLRYLPAYLKPGGRVAILTFHSGEDRRVKQALADGMRQGHYAAIALEVRRPDALERQENPRSSAAKLRWAQKGREA